jgi:hypothetical protein
MMWDQKASRALSQVLLGVWTGISMSWLGLAALVILSFLWPANQVPHVLLGVWLCAIVARLVWPGLERGELSLSWQILFAPFDPIFQAGGWVRRALGL